MAAWKNADLVLYQGDCLDLPPKIPDGFVWLEECVRVLDQMGSLCWQVGNYVQNGEIIPLDIALYPIFASLGLHLRNRIVWHFGHGLHASKRFSGRYEELL